MGRGQGIPAFKEAACCSDQPLWGAAWDTGGPHDCPSDKPEGASPGPMKRKAGRPGVEPACLRSGAGAPHAKLLVQAQRVCSMAAPRQEENSSCAATEGASGGGDGGGYHHRVLREVFRKGWPHGDRPSRKWSGDPGSSLTCQYCPHHACVLGPGLQSLAGGPPGGSGSDSDPETGGEAPSPLRQRAQCLAIRGALPYFQNCCSEAVEIGMLFMTKPIQSQLLFCFKNL